ncbi:MAG: transketolase C-terminal domain-containing protein [Bdellovibrionales bacterium]|jgi:transketolase|nr:transketolase C-terminal domain-containing protein [Bdellovibrionales bacterium]
MADTTSNSTESGSISSSSSAVSSAVSAAVAPLQVKPRLATARGLTPKWSATVQRQSGESLKVADPKATRAMVALMDMEAVLGGAASHFGGPSAFAELMSATHGLMFADAEKKSGSSDRATEWFDLYHFVNDAGHCENGIYALKANYGMAGLSLESLAGFRSISSKLTGHGEAHLFPEGVLISNGPLGSGLPQAQGLAFADALSGNRKRVTVCALSDGGAMEGEAREAFAAIPGLAAKGKMAPFVLIISDNRTKLSGRIDQDSYSMEPTFKGLEALGWRVLRLEEGHSLQACATTLEEAFEASRQNPTVPIVIHAKTVKGKGNKKAEASASGAHGFPLKSAKELPAFLSEIYGETEAGKGVPPEFMGWYEKVAAREAKMAEEKASRVAATVLPQAAGAKLLKSHPSEKIQLGVAKAMIDARKRGRPVVSVSADLQGSTGVADFHKAFPEAGFDVGIAESNMVSTAAGLSLAGYIPFVDTFAQFGVTKGALPITMANLSLAPVIAVFSHTGFQDAADGASHQALSFYAQVASIPHVEVYSLSTSSEADDLITEAIEDFANARERGEVPPTRIFFLGRENFPRRLTADGTRHALSSWSPSLTIPAGGKGKSVTLVANGSLLPEALKAADILAEKGVGSTVIHASSVTQIDVKTLKQALAASEGRLVTVEDHRLVGGMGALVAHALLNEAGAADKTSALRLRSLGVGDSFGQSAYSALELYKRHGLDASAIAGAAESLL